MLPYEWPRRERPGMSPTSRRSARRMRDAMRDDDRVFLIGEDVGHFGGPFGVTDRAVRRVRRRARASTRRSPRRASSARRSAPPGWASGRSPSCSSPTSSSCPFDQIVTVGGEDALAQRASRCPS